MDLLALSSLVTSASSRHPIPRRRPGQRCRTPVQFGLQKRQGDRTHFFRDGVVMMSALQLVFAVLSLAVAYAGSYVGDYLIGRYTA